MRQIFKRKSKKPVLGVHQGSTESRLAADSTLESLDGNAYQTMTSERVTGTTGPQAVVFPPQEGFNGLTSSETGSDSGESRGQSMHSEYRMIPLSRHHESQGRDRVRFWLEQASVRISEATHRGLDRKGHKNKKAYKYPIIPGENRVNEDFARTSEQFTELRMQRVANSASSTRSFNGEGPLEPPAGKTRPRANTNPDAITPIPRRDTLEVPEVAYYSPKLQLNEHDRCSVQSAGTKSPWANTNPDAITPILRRDTLEVPEVAYYSPKLRSNEDDRRSVQSADTLKSRFSALSGYTAVEMQGATSELRRIFQENLDLIPLYKRAIKDTSIGPERLQRNLARLLKQMAQDVGTEASKETEILTSRFLSTKARYIAHCIVEDCYNMLVLARDDRKPEETPESDVEVELEVETGQEYEIDGAEQVQHVDEDRFEDLAIFRSFLLQSHAFQKFRNRLTIFVLPKRSRSDETGSILDLTEIIPAQTRLYAALGWAEHISKAFISAIGLVEPRLEPSNIRLRWQCRCDKSFFFDVREYVPGGIDRLKQRLQRSGCQNITGDTYNPGTTDRRYTFQPAAWLRSASKSISSMFTRTVQNPPHLPQHHTPRVSSSTFLRVKSSVSPRQLYLMICMHRTEHHINVIQDSLEDIATDRQLFRFLEKQLRRHRRWFGNMLTMRRVRRIFFVKFRLRKGSVAEVRHHRTCCTQQTCECIPPPLKVLRPPMGSGEYDCNPSGPPDTWPPVCPEFMMHMLRSPACIAEDDSSILEQLPKKLNCKLAETNGSPPEGWGLYFQEEVDISAIIGVVFMVLFIASLLFIILWTVLKDDIQGASGVSAYIVAVASMLGIWIAASSRSFG